MPTQVMTGASGTDGRVQTAAGLVVAGIASWRRQSKTNMVPLPHFESPANADGLVQPRKLRGLGDTTIALEGLCNITVTGDGGTHAALENGKYVTLDLLVSRGSSLGYADVPGWISDFQIGSKVSNEAASFSATLEVDGVMPQFGAV